MKHLARNIIKTYEEETNQILEDLPEVPEYQEIEDHKEAKTVMKNYLETVIEKASTNPCKDNKETANLIEKAKVILNDPKFINQKGTKSLIDEDARVGRKSKTQDFYGYKTEFVMTTEERIITSIKTANGAYIDWSYAKELLDNTKKAGVNIREVYGDKAYFRKFILDDIESVQAKAYIPVSAVVYRLDETKFTYNKDSDEWQCMQGNTSIERKYFTGTSRGNFRAGYKYYFDIAQCEKCPIHDECAGNDTRKVLQVGLNTM